MSAIESTEFLVGYGVPAFFYGRHLAGIAWRGQVKVVERHNKSEYHYGDDPLHPRTAAALAFITGGATWPATMFIRGWLSLSQKKDPRYMAVNHCIKSIFVAQPPRKERLEARKKSLEERTAELEKELDLF